MHFWQNVQAKRISTAAPTMNRCQTPHDIVLPKRRNGSANGGNLLQEQPGKDAATFLYSGAIACLSRGYHGAKRACALLLLGAQESEVLITRSSNGNLSFLAPWLNTWFKWVATLRQVNCYDVNSFYTLALFNVFVRGGINGRFLLCKVSAIF